MESEKVIKELGKVIKGLVENQEDIVKNQKGTLKNIGGIIGLIEKLIKKISILFIIVFGFIGATIGFILSKPINLLLNLLKGWFVKLTENWQIAMVLIFAGLVSVLIGVLFGFFLGRKFPAKPFQSEPSQNRKNNKEDKE